MLPGDTIESVYGRVIRIAGEPKTAARGGYLFRGLEIQGQSDNFRTFIMFPEFSGQAIFEFPLLCWEDASVSAYDLQLNNELNDGTLIYTATPDSDLILEPYRPVSVTEAVEAAECLTSVDVRSRTGADEPFWMAKGRMIHDLFDYLLHRPEEWREASFHDAYRRALPALMEVLPGSTRSIQEKSLEREVGTHFRNLVAWLTANSEAFTTAKVEADGISTRWGLKGRADAIFTGSDGPSILELKSGRVPVDAHPNQLHAYSLLFGANAGSQRPGGWVLYSATGEARAMSGLQREMTTRIIEGRNRVVALKHSYTMDPLPMELGAGGFPCSRPKGRCFNRKTCAILFGDFSGGSPAFVGKDRDYYDRWFRLVSIDAWEREGEFARVLDPSTLAERVDEGVTFTLEALTVEDVSPRWSQHKTSLSESERGRRADNSRDYSRKHELTHGSVVVSGRPTGTGNTSEVSKGEELIVHPGDPSADGAFRARVIEADQERIILQCKVPIAIAGDGYTRNPMALPDSDTWYVERVPFLRQREVARQSLLDFFNKAHKSVVHAVVHGESGESSTPPRPEDDFAKFASNGESLSSNAPGGQPARSIPEEPTDESVELDDLCYSEGLLAELNEDQEAAIQAALQSETYHLIHGPPGTGKTRVLARLIRLCLDRGERVLVACPTNVALDGLLIAVLNLGVREFLRVGRRSSTSQAFREALDRIGSPPALLRELASSGMDMAAFVRSIRSMQLVGATAYQCAAHPIFLRQRFDRVIIDEAGQLDEPSVLAPLSLARRFVLGGDHLQLPPIAQARVPEADTGDGPGLEQSLFERMFLTVPAERISRLRMQYRMNQEVQDIPSRLFYDGSLFPSPDAKKRRLSVEPGVSSMAEVNTILDPEIPVLFVDVEGPSSGKARPEEAEVACRIVEGLLSGGVPSHEIGIITPYRAQQALIRKRLSRGNGAPSLSVDTVDRFQGGEREVILVSLSRSDGVTSFLADRKRLNVSLSRARSKLILLGHGRVLEEHPLFASILKGLQRVRICPEC